MPPPEGAPTQPDRRGGRPPHAAGRDLGLILLVPGVLAATAVVVALATGETFALPGFLLTLLLSGAVGGGLVARNRRPDRSGRPVPSMTHSWMAAAWLLAALLCALPFVWVGSAAGATPSMAVFADPVNAVFESMSGLTSTGLTVANDSSTLPRTIQWWRSVLQWIGGVGVLYLALVLIEPGVGYAGDEEALSDEMDLAVLEDEEWGGHIIRDVWAIYGVYTLAAMGAFWAAGMPAWEALNHGLTGMSTGGFTVTADSFQSYSPEVKLVGVVVMVLGAISFVLHYLAVIRRRFRPLARDAQLRSFALLLLAGPVVLGIAVRSAGVDAGVVDLVFEWTSALATCGFAVADEPAMGTPALGLLIMAMFVGGLSGSTVGGLKQRRLIHLLSGLVGWLRGRRPSPVEINGVVEASDEEPKKVREAVRVLLALTGTLGVGTVLLALTLGGTYPVSDLLFEATSAIATVGLSAGVVGPDLPATARLILVALMWMGRLEIFAVFALVGALVASVRSAGGARSPGR